MEQLCRTFWQLNRAMAHLNQVMQEKVKANRRWRTILSLPRKNSLKAMCSTRKQSDTVQITRMRSKVGSEKRPHAVQGQGRK
jgi:hypothetical protein